MTPLFKHFQGKGINIGGLLLERFVRPVQGVSQTQHIPSKDKARARLDPECVEKGQTYLGA